MKHCSLAIILAVATFLAGSFVVPAQSNPYDRAGGASFGGGI